MIQKTKILIFSTAFLTISALSVQAMEETKYDRRRTRPRVEDIEKIRALYGRVPQTLENHLKSNECVITALKSQMLDEEKISVDNDFSLESPLQDDTHEVTEENGTLLKSFDVDSPEFQNVVDFYKKNPQGDLKRLVDYFECILSLGRLSDGLT